MTPLNNKAEDWLAQMQPESNMQKMHIAGSDKPIALYNLNVIISRGLPREIPGGYVKS